MHRYGNKGGRNKAEIATTDLVSLTKQLKERFLTEPVLS